MRTALTAFIVTPAPEGSTAGNRVTALRWAKRLRELGARVRIDRAWGGEPCDLLIALHARKSHASIARHAKEQPRAPRVVALTGTDLYGDLAHDELARESLELATHIVLLQARGLDRLPSHLRDRASVIVQSARAVTGVPHLPDFTALVLAHLRDVKDPLLVADAAALLPAHSRCRVLHLGDAPDETWRERARQAERSTHGRWSWLGARPRCEALRLLAGADVLVVASRSEGGANVVTEAIAANVPVLSTRIDGSLGILGDDYPGYFAVGDAAACARLLERCETDEPFRQDLQQRIGALRPLVDPARERERWRALLDELDELG